METTKLTWSQRQSQTSLYPFDLLMADQSSGSSHVLVNHYMYWGHVKEHDQPRVSASLKSPPYTKSESLKLLHNQRAAWPMGECAFSRNCFCFYKRVRNSSSSSATFYASPCGDGGGGSFRSFLNFVSFISWTVYVLFTLWVWRSCSERIAFSPVHRAWLFQPRNWFLGSHCTLVGVSVTLLRACPNSHL